MSNKIRFYYAIAVEQFRIGSLDAVLDMLRYDNAQVLGKERGHWIFQAPTHPTIDRWKSFGIKVALVKKDEHLPSFDELTKEPTDG
jgi:hypothetical protein